MEIFYQRRVGRRSEGGDGDGFYGRGRGEGFGADALADVPNADLFEGGSKEVLAGAVVGDVGVAGGDDAEDRCLLVAEVRLHHRMWISAATCVLVLKDLKEETAQGLGATKGFKSDPWALSQPITRLRIKTVSVKG